jgi:hypothetical protein
VSLTILSEPNELGEKFRDCCRRYSRLDVAVAWCGDPTYKLPYGDLGEFRGQIHATVGISFNRTHPDAIAWFMQQDRVHLRIVRDDKALFHPKVYLFSRGDAYALIVGSSNLTFSGFHANVEVNAYVRGKFSDALPGVAQLRDRLSEWRTDAYSLVPSNRWLSAYRKRYVATLKKARKASVKTEPQAEEEIATASWLGQADWNVYHSEVLAGLKHYEEREDGIRAALDAGARLLVRPWRTTYFADEERRRVINGIGDYAALGHVGASGAFRRLIKNGRAAQHRTIVRSMNTIAGLSHPVQWSLLKRVLTDLVNLGPTMKVWGRLLCLVKPDLFCTISSPSVRANLSKVLEVPQSEFTQVAGYIKLIQLLHASPWFNSAAPQSKKAQYIWQRRVAFMDAIFY